MAQSFTSDHASDEDLALYALNRMEVDTATAAHIAQCAICQREAEKFGSLLQEMDVYLYRVTCPSPETLTDYAGETLPWEERRAVEAHLKECAYCAEETRATRDFFARTAPDVAEWSATSSLQAFDTPDPDAPVALTRLIAQLLPTASLEFNPAFPLLGSPDEQEALQVFHANGLTISVRQETGPDAHVVMGVIRQDAEAAPGESALFARLIQEREDATESAPEPPVPQSAIVRDAFEFDQVQPGRYRIEVFFPTLVVVVGPITVDAL